MDTWMELAKVPKEIRCMLGRWATSNEEGYLRHLEASVCGAQVKVAEMLRSPPTAELAAHEDEVVKKLSRYLEGRGMDQSRIDRQVFRLQSSLREETLEVSTGSNLRSRTDRSTLDDFANLGAGVSREVAVSSEVDTDDVSMDEMSDEGDLGPDHCMGDYVFSILGTSKRRTLHRIGECFRYQVPTTGITSWWGLIDLSWVKEIGSAKTASQELENLRWSRSLRNALPAPPQVGKEKRIERSSKEGNWREGPKGDESCNRDGERRDGGGLRPVTRDGAPSLL